MKMFKKTNGRIIGAAVGLALVFVLSAFVQDDLQWYLLMYNGEGSDAMERMFAALFFAIFGLLGLSIGGDI
jgi:hypothetical protein